MNWCSFFFLICLGSSVMADIGPDVVGEMLANHQAGIICAPPIAGSTAAPGTVAGSAHLIDQEPEFISHKRRVPAVRGIAFGVKAQSAATGGIDGVTMTIRHPAMSISGTKTQTIETSISGSNPSLSFYQFDFDYELVTGIWQIQAMRGDTVIYRTTFEVVPPKQVPELAAICGYAELLS